MPRNLQALSRLSPSTSLLVTLVILSSCGGGGSKGGGGGTSPPPPPAAAFQLAVTPSSVTVPAGESTAFTISDTATDGFNSTISVAVSGLPTGVTISPSTISLTGNASMQISISAPPNTSQNAVPVTFLGTAGTTASTATLSLSVGPASISSNIPPSRTRYIRTKSTTEYATSFPAQWTVFDPLTSQFFVSDPATSHVMVIDAATQTLVKTLTIPGAYGMDDTADHKTIYLGTQIGDVYTIDTGSLTVTKRYLASQIGPKGFGAISALVLTDGNIALLGSPGGIPVVDGSPGMAVWNPSTNAIAIYATTYGITQFPQGEGVLVCSPTDANFFSFARTVDRSKVLVGSLSLCEIDPSTGKRTYVQPVGAAGPIVTSPDGKYLALPIYPDQIELYDSKTLAAESTITTADQDMDGSALFFSADSSKIFATTDTVAYEYDVASGQQVGWSPNLWVSFLFGGSAGGPIDSPIIQAVDNTGLLAGPMEEGVGFLDSNAFNPGPVGTLFTNAYLNPPGGPIGGGTDTTWGVAQTVDKSRVYFGSQKATFSSTSGDLGTVVTPPGAPGPADVYAYSTDGGIQIIPEGFSYAPTILEVTPNISGADGGGTGVIFGYGFGPQSSYVIPEGFQVYVGGNPATVTAYDPDAYGTEGAPFLLQSIWYTVPPGTPGTADVRVVNSAGTTTAAGAFTYLPKIVTYPLNGAQLAAGIYDPHNDQYYFTDQHQLQVFSLPQGAWLPPIPIPALKDSPQRLWSLALSPDGSKLAVSDTLTGVVYVVSPSSPSNVQSFPIVQPFVPTGTITNAVGIAINNAGIVYILASVQGGSGFQNIFSLDTTTGKLTALNPGGSTVDNYLRIAFTSDANKLYMNADGNVFIFDTANNSMSLASNEQTCCYDNDELAISPNYKHVGAAAALYDTNLNMSAFEVLDDYEFEYMSYVYAAKFSAAGGLLYQPSAAGIDVFDGGLGDLLGRIALPFALTTNYDALVSDGTDNKLIAITGASGNGIAVIDLSSIPEPAALPYEKRSVASADAASNSTHLRPRRAQTAVRAATQEHPRNVIRHYAESAASHPAGPTANGVQSSPR
jgi:hypothetical protein